MGRRYEYLKPQGRKGWIIVRDAKTKKIVRWIREKEFKRRRRKRRSRKRR